MNHLLVFILIYFTAFNAFGQTYYHLADYSGPEPIIKLRCIEVSQIKNTESGYIKEYRDTLNRCTKIEFYEDENLLWSSIDMPSIVTYTWTDSSVIESLFGVDHNLLTYEGKLIRPNKIEYITSDSLVIKIKKYFNNSLLTTDILADKTPIEKVSFFFIYTGCSIKYNENYRLQF